MQHAERDIRAGAGSEAAAGPNTAVGCLWAGNGSTRLRSAPGDLGTPASSYFLSNCPGGENFLLAPIDSTLFDTSSSFFQSGSLNIVPEPHTALLFGMGLTFMGARPQSQQSRHPDRFLGKGKRSITPEREML